MMVSVSNESLHMSVLAPGQFRMSSSGAQSSTAWQQQCSVCANEQQQQYISTAIMHEKHCRLRAAHDYQYVAG
jgi:hypothetical protein